MPGRSSIGRPAPPTVLVVDANPAARAEIAGWLRDAGYAIQEADAFEPARRLLQTHPPDVLVAGLRLGAFNGLHLIISARAARPELRAVLLATREDAALAGDARRANAGYLVQPIRRDTFLAAVARNS